MNGTRHTAQGFQRTRGNWKIESTADGRGQSRTTAFLEIV